MAAAAKGLEGEHDYRNFCKMDIEHVSHFNRSILSFEIRPVLPAGQLGPALSAEAAGAAAEAAAAAAGPAESMWAMKIVGSAFLWHQVSFRGRSCGPLTLSQQQPHSRAHWELF